MHCRFLALRGVLAIVMAVGLLAPVLIAGQALSPAAQTWTPSRTAWGEPDLQGTWSFATITPLQRPDALAGKEIFTDEELAEVNEEAAQSRPGNDLPPRAGDPGTYNDFWWERGKSTGRTSLIVDPPDGRLPALTPAAQKRQAAVSEARRRPATSWEDRSPGERCVHHTKAGPPMSSGGYNNNFQLFQTPGYVVILSEQIHDARIIPLDGRPHLGQNIRQWMGDSRARWEGDTLVVDTTNFNGKMAYQGSGASLHLVERFTRVDADTMTYEFTVEDSTSYARPWTATMPLRRTQELMYEYACHEGNYGMYNILAGARADEQAAEQAVKKGSR